MPMTRSLFVPAPAGGTSLAVHGGAGGRLREFTADEQRGYRAGLARAHGAGQAVLGDGGTALEAVVAAVQVLEDDPLFNAGRGAALTREGHAELDAAVATGDGRCGAVACSRHARNPVLLARHVMEHTEHVLLVAPDEAMVRRAGLALADDGWFVTERRREQLAHHLAGGSDAQRERHGTVGAVARDTAGRLAAATSTGGILAQHEGRVGDSPVVGAGTWADDATCAISCTGDGEAFLAGCVAHDIHARLRYTGQALPEAAASTFAEQVERRHASGGLVAVGRDGAVLAAFSSAMIFAALRDEHGELQVWA